MLSILKRIDDDNSLKIPSTINVQFIADVLTGSYYTKVLSDKDIEPVLKKFKQIANNKNKNNTTNNKRKQTQKQNIKH